MDITTIICPVCNTAIPVTEALARPFLDAEREKLQLEVRKQREALDREKREFGVAVARRLADERKKIRCDAAREAEQYWKAKLAERDSEIADKDSKLVRAQESELKLRKDRQALEDEKRKLELEVERRVDQERLRIRITTQKEEEDAYRLKIAEKDSVIEGMRKQVEELRRKAEQGAPQIQGEVQEVELEYQLRSAFPHDEISSVPAGRPGGDILQRVIGLNGTSCGTILWESKRTKSWDQEWLEKNRQDQRQIGAQVGIIVSACLPRGVDAFDLLRGVWVVALKFAVPLARALRQGVIEATRSQLASKDRAENRDRIYSYVTGPEFRKRVSAIVEAYVAMQQDLDAEKRALTRCWAKRRRHLDLMISQAAGMYGDMQGLIGTALPEVEGLGMQPGQLPAEPLLFPPPPRWGKR